MALTIKDVQPLFEALETVQYTAIRYTRRKPHDLNLKAALRRVRRVRDALETDFRALPR